ncbi:hypothetical protein LPJ79_005247 [Coemansia sp. RSA 1821]|nr:hypothetical protein LPJ79_005247 [Coemansia sp. RSA 1821]
MREVLTLQFGENANYVGSHYWNLQEAGASRDRVGELFVERSNQPAVPRALVFDAVGNFGALPLEEEMQSAGTDQLDEEQALWNGPKQVHRQPLHPRPQSDSPDQPTQGVRFWSDYGQTKYAPHAIHAISGVEFGNSLGEMNTFQEGLQVFSGNDARDEMLEGSFRIFVEECDQLQGFQVLADAFGGFSGFGAGLVAKIRDEYPKSSILLYSVGRLQRSGRLQGTQLMDAAVATAFNIDIASMAVPLFAPSLPPTRLQGHLQIADDDFYQVSAFMATNVAQWSHCLHGGQRILSEIVEQVTQQEYYKLAETALSPGLSIPAIDLRDSRSVLVEADKLVESSFISCSDAAVSKITTTAGQLVVDRGTGFSKIISSRYPVSAYIEDSNPVALPKAFPRIFRKSEKKCASMLQSARTADKLRVAGMLSTSSSSLDYLQNLHAALQSEQSRHYKDFERDTVREYRYTLDRLIDKYFTSASGAGQLPLKGVRVLDLTRILAGPFCTMLLGDLGAEVIKVEHPQRGDDTRTWGPPFKDYEQPFATQSSFAKFPGESAYYLSVNRNKKSIAIDMKIESGRTIIRELAAKSDVLVENFVPGKLAEMQLSFEDLQKINPRLVYASISGYGQTGPYKYKPGYDVIIEAEAGLMHITGEKSGPPVKVGVAVTDIMTGLYTHGAIMAALLARQQSGRGQHIDASLMQTQTSILANIASNYLIGSQEAERWGTCHPSIAPYQVFATQDGNICIGAGNNQQFASLCTALQRPELKTDSRFLTNADRVANRGILIPILQDILKRKTTQQVLDILEGCGLPFGPVNNLQQTFDHPQVKARNIVRQVEHPFVGQIKMVGPAVEFSDAPVGKDIQPPPMLGQHTEQVLSNHPLVQQKISALRQASNTSQAFRELTDGIGRLLMYEATLDLSLIVDNTKQAHSPVSTYHPVSIATQHALVPILRSGLGLLNAASDFLPHAQVHHLGLFREESTLLPVEYYNKLPQKCTVDECIVLDPMIATGGTADAAIKILKTWGVPRIKFVTICASRQGIERLSKEHPDVQFYVAVIDNELNEQGFVVPGIGDCGDRLNNTGSS